MRTRAGTTETARGTVEWAREAEERGAGEILLTSIDADGTREGYDLEITRAVADAVSVPVIASGGAGDAQPCRRGARGRAGGAARVDPARGSRSGSRRCATSCARWGWRSAMQPEGELRAAIVQDAETRPRADARVDGRRGRAPHARVGRGVVLEPLARGVLAQGRDLRATRWRSRSCATTATATRCCCACARTGPRATPARCRASRRRSGARSPSARRTGPRARTRRSSSTRASPPCARKVGEEAVEVVTAALAESDERLVSEAADLSTTCTSCSPRAASISPRSRTSSRGARASTSFSPRASISTNCAIRRARVSGRFASWIA